MSREYRKAYRRVKYDYKMLSWAKGKCRDAQRDVDTWTSQEADYRTKWENSLIELGDVAVRDDKLNDLVAQTMQDQKEKK